MFTNPAFYLKNNDPHSFFARLLILLMVACAFFPISVTATVPVASPTKIIIYDLSFNPDVVKVDESAVANAKAKSTVYSRKIAVGNQVAAAVAAEMIKELKVLGVDVEHIKKHTAYSTRAFLANETKVSNDSAFLNNKSLSKNKHSSNNHSSLIQQSKENVLIIKGHFTNIEEGNRNRRVLIGFNSSSSIIVADVKIIQGIHDSHQSFRKLMAQFQTSEKTFIKPGILPMALLGVATGRVVEAVIVSTAVNTVGEINPKLENLAKQTAKDIVSQIKPYIKK